MFTFYFFIIVVLGGATLEYLRTFLQCIICIIRTANMFSEVAVLPEIPSEGSSYSTPCQQMILSVFIMLAVLNVKNTFKGKKRFTVSPSLLGSLALT
jgi:hypothetical protein